MTHTYKVSPTVYQRLVEGERVINWPHGKVTPSVGDAFKFEEFDAEVGLTGNSLVRKVLSISEGETYKDTYRIDIE